MRDKVVIKSTDSRSHIVCEYLLYKPPELTDIVGKQYFQELDISILQWAHGNLMNLYYDAYTDYKN